MTEIATVIGFIVLAAFAACVMILLAYLLVDAVMCARFVWRIRKAAIVDDNRIGDWRLVKRWFGYWAGIERRPNYLALISTDEAIYWPGKEGTRRYPG